MQSKKVTEGEKLIAWQLDPNHTEVGFEVRHMMVSKVRGRFGDVEGAITFADDPAQSSVEVTIAVGSDWPLHPSVFDGVTVAST